MTFAFLKYKIEKYFIAVITFIAVRILMSLFTFDVYHFTIREGEMYYIRPSLILISSFPPMKMLDTGMQTSCHLTRAIKP